MNKISTKTSANNIKKGQKDKVEITVSTDKFILLRK